MSDLAAAWDELRAVLPRGWVVGRHVEHSGEGRWVLYAHDPAERPRVGKRSREVEVAAPTELEVVLEMARRLPTGRSASRRSAGTVRLPGSAPDPPRPRHPGMGRAPGDRDPRPPDP